MAEHKILGIILSVGLLIVAGIFWVLDEEETASKDVGAQTVAVAPPDTSTETEQPAKPQITGEPVDEALADKVLVSTRPVQVLAEPSASASAMFGFPAGRPFRAISKQDGYIRIKDVRSGASGWIEEAALAPAPTKPVAAPPSAGSRSATSGSPSQRRSASPAETATAEPQPAAPEPKRRGLFGGGGLLGGLFGGN